MGCSLNTRQRSANVLQQAFTSGMGMITIWWYYWFVNWDATSILLIGVGFYGGALLIWALISTIMFFLIIGAAIAEDRDMISQTFHDRLLTIEIILSDAPKFIIVLIIEAQRAGSWSGIATMAMLAAFYNAVFDFLTMMRNGEEADDSPDDDTVDDRADDRARREQKEKKKKSKKAKKQRKYISDSESDYSSVDDPAGDRARKEQKGRKKKAKKKQYEPRKDVESQSDSDYSSEGASS